MNDTKPQARRLQIPRSRGAATGLLLILLGAWGALIPFIGPYFNFAFIPDAGLTWTAARGVFEVLPGVATVLGGWLLMTSTNRATTMFGSWLAVIAGAWFVVGRLFADVLPFGAIGAPATTSTTMAAWLEVAYFYGVGALIVFLGATAMGRLSVRSPRDVDRITRQTETSHGWGRLFGRGHRPAHR